MNIEDKSLKTYLIKYKQAYSSKYSNYFHHEEKVVVSTSLANSINAFLDHTNESKTYVEIIEVKKLSNKNVLNGETGSPI